MKIDVLDFIQQKLQSNKKIVYCIPAWPQSLHEIVFMYCVSLNQAKMRYIILCIGPYGRYDRPQCIIQEQGLISF